MEEEGFAWLHRHCTGKERKAKLALSSLTQPKVHKRETPALQLCDPDTATTKVGTSSPEEPKKLCPAGPPTQPSHTQKASASAQPANISVSDLLGAPQVGTQSNQQLFFPPSSSHLNPPPPGQGCTAAPVHRFSRGCLKTYPCCPIKRDPMHYYPTSQQFQPHCFQADTFLSKRQKIEKKIPCRFSSSFRSLLKPLFCSTSISALTVPGNRIRQVTVGSDYRLLPF